ncbi:MAG: Ldh family oxidoreductase [Dehalococcoidia bacterium]|nr:Ldh family oxidoreductase [Dehalococcoidia bacterium]
MLIPDDPRARYRADELTAFTAAVFERFDMPAGDAAAAAEVLIDADISGIESHGIAHLPWHPGYAPGFKNSIVNPRPEIRIERDSAVAATWDAGGGLGVLVARRAMEACIAKADATGMGMIAVRNGRHFGAAGYYARMAAERDMVGMAMCNVLPLATASGSIDRAFGTNPIAMGAPVQDDHPFLLDMATTAVAGGKLEIAMRQGKGIPAGWAVDAAGAETADPAILRAGGALTPLGSTVVTSAHKGYGLGIMVDILTGVLPGMGSAIFAPRHEQGWWFAAWRIDAFRDVDGFKADMKRMVDHLRTLRPLPGIDRVRVAGDPEFEAREDRLANGVPLDEETIEQLKTLATDLGLEFPAPIAAARDDG